MNQNRLKTIGAALLGGLLAACAGRAEAAASGFTPLQAEGERLFLVYCSPCHSTLPETVIVGPSLAGVGQRAGTLMPGMDARSYLETSILSPGEYVVGGFKDLMPATFGETLTAEERQALVAYLLTIP
jgi:mono/diheme cytochrome c family protein